MPDPTPQPGQAQPNGGEPDPRSTSGIMSGASGLSSVTLSNAPKGSKSDRQTFAADELAIVLSHFDIGVINQIVEFPRGSRKAPKLLIKAKKGPLLLKRRAKGKHEPEKVAFCHGLQLHLAAKQFPLPHLIKTVDKGKSMLRLGERTYELFEYIQGTPYDQSLEATQDAGKILGLMHKLLRDYKVKLPPPSGSYHDARSVYASFAQLPKTFAKLKPNNEPVTSKCVTTLNHYYRDAVKRVESAGLDEWPKQIVHSDWHPGNMLFRGNMVVAVIDYDTARIHQRVIDVANGALQFSILGGGEDPLTWPEGIDLARYKRFLMGYDAVPDNVLTRAELKVIPWLMMQALIAESVIPIAKTGRFARLEGGVFLEMVRRKCDWMIEHADQLVEMVDN